MNMNPLKFLKRRSEKLDDLDTVTNYLIGARANAKRLERSLRGYKAENSALRRENRILTNKLADGIEKAAIQVHE